MATREYELQITGLHPGQHDVLTDGHRYQMVACGRRWGKTRVGVAKAVRGACVVPGRYWWVTPTYKHAEEGWDVLKEFSAQFPPRTVSVRESDRRVTFPTGGIVEIRSADDPNSLRSKGLHGVVLDEASYMKKEAWQAVRPALSDHRGWATFLFSPRGFNWVWEMFERAKVRAETWKTWQRSTSENPKIDPDELADALEELGALIFSQEYDAQFVSHAGRLFAPEHFRYWTPADMANWIILHPEDGKQPRYVHRDDLRIFVTVDPAATEKETSSYFALGVWAVTKENDLILAHMVRERAETTRHLPILRSIYQQFQPGFIGVEKANIGLGLIQAAVADGLPIKELMAEKDKVSRARVAQARYETHKVFHPAGMPWLPAFEAELMAFPDGAYNDQVDVTAYAAIEVAAGWPGAKKGRSPYA